LTFLALNDKICHSITLLLSMCCKFIDKTEIGCKLNMQGNKYQTHTKATNVIDE